MHLFTLKVSYDNDLSSLHMSKGFQPHRLGYEEAPFKIRQKLSGTNLQKRNNIYQVRAIQRGKRSHQGHQGGGLLSIREQDPTASSYHLFPHRCLCHV